MHKAARMAGTAAVAAAGAVGTYLYMKPKLRKDLKKAHTANEAMNLVGRELEHDALAVAGKAMDLGSEGLHAISKSLSPRPTATRKVAVRAKKSPRKTEVSVAMAKK